MTIRNFTFTPSTVRIAGAASLAFLAVCAAGCTPESDGESESVGEAESPLITWNASSFSSTSNLSGLAMPSGDWKCVLSGVLGNFNLGQSSQWDVKSLFSEAGPSGLTLDAHGGAYTNANNERVWAGNPVGAKATCFDGASATSAGSALWGGISSNYSPKKIAGLGSNRQCFLQHLEAGDGTYNSANSYVRVKKYTTTDSQHTSQGWYVEGSLNLFPGTVGYPAVRAVCYDFPGASEFGTYSISSAPGLPNTQATYANYLAGCGLTMIQGPFTSSSVNNGVTVEMDSGTGLWTLHAYGGQAGTAVCVD